MFLLGFSLLTLMAHAQEAQGLQFLGALRFVAGEFSPDYMLTDNISIGMYYLYGHGFQTSVTQNSHFLTLNSNFSNISLIYAFNREYTRKYGGSKYAFIHVRIEGMS